MSNQVDADGYPIESTSQSDTQSVNQSNNLSTSQLSERFQLSGLKSPTSTSPALTSETGPTITETISQSITQSNNQSASPANDQSASQTSSQTNGQSPSESANQSTAHSSTQAAASNLPKIKRASLTSVKATLASLEIDENFLWGNLTHSFYPTVSEKMEQSLGEVKKVGEFLSKVVKAKQAYSNALFSALSDINKSSTPAGELRNLGVHLGSNLAPNSAEVQGQRSRSSSVSNPTAGHRSRSNSSAGHDHEMIGKRATNAWKTLRDIIEAEAISDARAAQAYQETVVTPLLNYHRDAENKRKVLMEHFESMQAQVKESHQRMLQTKIQVLKLLESQKHAEAREAQEKEERAKAEAAGKLNDFEIAKAGKGVKSSLSFLFKNKKEQITEALRSLSSDELREQAYQSVLMYQSSVDVANTRTVCFYEQDMPSIMRQAQMMETQRLETLRMHLERLSNHLKGLAEPSDQRIDSFGNAVKQLSTKADVEDFANELIAQIGTPHMPNQFIYDLGFTADDIKHNRVMDVAGQSSAAPAHSNVTPIFGSSLEQVMQAQKETHPELNVPFVLVSLCDTIRRLQRENKTGIYNSSPDQQEVWKARHVIEAGESLQTSDVEIPAALLKMWLRDLHPRVISHDAYDRALFVARENACDHSAVLGVYYSLGELQQRVIRHVAELAAELVSDAGENDESYDKLALTLAPHIMQNSSTDAQTVLSAVNDEIKFTAALLEAVAEDHAIKDKRAAAQQVESTALRSTVTSVSSTEHTDTTNQSSNPSSNQSSNASTGSIDGAVQPDVSDSELEPHPPSDDDRQMVDVPVSPPAQQ